MIKKAKSEFYLKSVTESLNNPSKFWKQIKSLLGTHVASSLPGYTLVGSDEIKDKAAMDSQFNKHCIHAGSVFDSLNLDTCSHVIPPL